MTYNRTRRRSFNTKQREAFFEARNGICYLCSGIIDTATQGWDIEHVIPRELMGEDADDDENLMLAHRKCHQAKTSIDRQIIAKSNHVRAKANGTKAKTSRPIPGSKASGLRKKFDGTVERRHPHTPTTGEA